MNIWQRLSIPTTTPEETLKKALDFFRPKSLSALRVPDPSYKIQAMGIASFGPIDLRKDSPTYGNITTTPKPGWAYTDLVTPIRDGFGIPVGFDTDVNGAALGEQGYGAGKGLTSLVYFTVGTGIGGGALVNGEPIHGLVHTEMGHFPVERHPDDKYEGICAYHKDCLEGLATGPSIQARWGAPGSQLPVDHAAWEMEAYYLAQAVCDVVYALSPQRIIMGGGVMHQAHLFPLIRQKTLKRLNGYVQSPVILKHIDTVIVPPGLGDDAGIMGALELARRAAEESK